MAERQARLINDVLDLAKIEAGRIDWNDSRINIARLVEDAANGVRGMFESKPTAALRYDVAAGLPEIVGDADRLQQVLINLLNNAAKFTEQDEVALVAAINPAGLLQIEIRDTDIGFPPEDAGKIFDKFQQSSQGDTLTDRPKGTGLGLSIAREIITRHGGQIKASSQPGVGSVFTLMLPLAKDAAAAARAPTSAAKAAEPPAAISPIHPVQHVTLGLTEEHLPQGAAKVLVVDDDSAVRNYLAQLLQEHGYRVFLAQNGEEALQLAKNIRPDLITMDLAMPVMDGHTAIIKLREDADLQHIPVLVISALPEVERAGGDAALGKPISEERLRQNIELLLGRRQVGDDACAFCLCWRLKTLPMT